VDGFRAVFIYMLPKQSREIFCKNGTD